MKKKFILLILSFLANLLCFSQTKNDIFEILDQISTDSIKRTVQDLQDFGTRRADRLPDGNLEVALYMVQRLQSYGIENAHIETFDGNGNTGYNVCGTLAGEISDSTVIIGAHLDSKNSYIPDILAPAPGADDNATGCAQTIEMARIFFEKKLKPKYNIDFMAYDFEESGLIGAKFDAQKRMNNSENIVVMLNNDMVGFQQIDLKWMVTLHWYDNSLPITNKAAEFCKLFTTITPVIPDAAYNYSMYKRSDSYAYFEMGYKTTFHIEYNFSPFYHQSQDLLEFLNFEYQKQVAHLNMALLLYYARVPEYLGVKDDEKTVQQVEVYPNPATEVVRVNHYNDMEVLEIRIFDMMGRIVDSYNCYGEQQIVINVKNYNKGVYILRITTDKGIINKKIIKQ